MPPIMSMDLQCSHCTALLQDDTTREILEELDRERTKRAELEQQVRDLQAELEAREDETMTISRKHYAALQTELKGYRDLVDALTKERPAISIALQATTRKRWIPKEYREKETQAKRNPPSLPLHVVRLLEIMPWDSRANEYAFGVEEVYEWQFYDSWQKTWKMDLGSSPKEFQNLPTEEPRADNAISEQSPRVGMGFWGHEGSHPSSSCVLTNRALTKLYNLQKGYPLPENGGTWQWVGGWRVEKRVSYNYDVSNNIPANNNSKQLAIDCDDHGWSYAMEASHFTADNPRELCWDQPTHNGKHVVRPIRRRKWTRLRALVDYPHASECTRHFLTLMAQRRYANMAANKLSEQLVTTKASLTMVESMLTQCQDDAAQQIRVLGELLKPKGMSKVTNANDAKTIVVAASELAKQMQHDIKQALANKKSGETFS